LQKRSLKDTILGRPFRNAADMIRRGQGWSGHRVRDRTAPFTPISCSTPDVTGPSLMAGGNRKQEVSPMESSMVPSPSRGGLEWIWACCTGSHGVKCVRPLSSCGIGTDITARRGCRQ